MVAGSRGQVVEVVAPGPRGLEEEVEDGLLLVDLGRLLAAKYGTKQ